MSKDFGYRTFVQIISTLRSALLRVSTIKSLQLRCHRDSIN